MSKHIKMYNGKVFGHEVSEEALEHGYLDYHTLSKIVGDMILNNEIMQVTGYENWELILGDYEDEDDGYFEIYQYYIISDYGYRMLEEYTDELVYYNEELDMYIWGITHYGTAWSYVLTDVVLTEEE